MMIEVPNVKVMIIKYLMKKGEATWEELKSNIDVNSITLAKHLKDLVKHGIVEARGNRFRIADEIVKIRVGD